MASPEVPHPKPGKGKHKPGSDGKKAGHGLTKKLGPLPVWGWGVGLILAVGLGLYLRKRAGKSSSSGDTATPTDSGTGSGGGGGVPLPPQPVDTAPTPFPPDTLGAALPGDTWPWTDTWPADETVTDAPIAGVGYASTDPDPFGAAQVNAMTEAALATGNTMGTVSRNQTRRDLVNSLSGLPQPNAATAAGALGAFGVRSIGRIPITTVRSAAPSRGAPHTAAIHHSAVRSAISLGEHSRSQREGSGSRQSTRHRQPSRPEPQHAGYSGYATGHVYSAPAHVAPPARTRTGGAGRTYAI